MRTDLKEESAVGWRRLIHEIVLESDTTAGRVFDVTVICLIVLSVAAVILESVREAYETFMIPHFWRRSGHSPCSFP